MTGAGSDEPGCVLWITGLPCVGKTTLGRALVRRRRHAPGRPVVLLDGDELRRACAEDLGYTRRDRQTAAGRYARLARLLSLQEFDVVVCTVSMDRAVWAWNRRHLPRYVEIYLTAPPEVRRRRDRLGIYDGDEVPGQDLPVDLPSDAHVHLVNDGGATPEALAEAILACSVVRALVHGTGAA